VRFAVVGVWHCVCVGVGGVYVYVCGRVLGRNGSEKIR
jgi:hypothetical protein